MLRYKTSINDKLFKLVEIYTSLCKTIQMQKLLIIYKKMKQIKGQYLYICYIKICKLYMGSYFEFFMLFLKTSGRDKYKNKRNILKN